MLLKGYKVAYSADAAVLHSHNYSMKQEFKRYFDLGVFLEKEHWILDTFGKAEGEGLRFVRSELAYLRDQGLSSSYSGQHRACGSQMVGLPPRPDAQLVTPLDNEAAEYALDLICAG